MPEILQQNHGSSATPFFNFFFTRTLLPAIMQNYIFTTLRNERISEKESESVTPGL